MRPFWLSYCSPQLQTLNLPVKGPVDRARELVRKAKKIAGKFEDDLELLKLIKKESILIKEIPDVKYHLHLNGLEDLRDKAFDRARLEFKMHESYNRLFRHQSTEFSRQHQNETDDQIG